MAFSPPPLPQTPMPPVPNSGKRKKSRKAPFGLLGFLLLTIVVSSMLIFINSPNTPSSGWDPALKEKIIETAREFGIEDHTDELLAIVTVESNGQAEDVFQSSESLGLPPNTLSRDASIRQGVEYYKTLLERARELGVDQDSVFQAYNFGIGYLDYVAEHGGFHTRELAEAFSKDYSQGKIVSYPNPIAINANGGWRYQYGNMFYVDLIHEVL